MPADLTADAATCYRAVVARDPRFDGRVFTGVRTTGIYCRPSCPSRTPRPENVRFYPSAAAAVAAGFRACRRCRPDALPGSRAWDHRADLVARALRLIAEGQVDEAGVRGLAARLAVSERHLHRSLVAEVGVGPLALARTRRAQTARLLVDQTPLPLSEVAFAAGFASIRQFNDVMRAEFGCAPSLLRRSPSATAEGGRAAGGGLVLRLVHREPFAAPHLLAFLAARAVPGLESAGDAGYRRVVRTPHGPGLFAATPVPGAGHVVVRLHLPDLADLATVVARVRRLLDLDAVDGFELAVRAVLGQQVSVAGARTLAGRLVAALGEPLSAVPTEEGAAGLTHAFPTATEVATADLGALGLTTARRRALQALAAEVAEGRLSLDPGADRAQTRTRLLALPGIGPWTAEYVALRALADPDAWPGTDLVLRRRVAARGADPDRWRPWRGYGAVHLWADAATADPTTTKETP